MEHPGLKWSGDDIIKDLRLAVSLAFNEGRLNVKSIVIRKPGASRGIRLVSMRSYRSYLRSLEEQQSRLKGNDPRH
jgi:hypothetical protein